MTITPVGLTSNSSTTTNASLNSSSHTNTNTPPLVSDHHAMEDDILLELNQHRARFYPQNHLGPYNVFLRACDGKKLGPTKLAVIVRKNYPSTQAISINQKQQRMRFTLLNRNEANEMIVDPILADYNVFIRPDEVEISGIINFNDICDIGSLEEIIKYGKGRFSYSQATPAKVVDAHRFESVIQKDNVSTRSNAVKITFAGGNLPTHMEIFGLFVKVRPWFQRAMFCDNCSQFQHTSKYCTRKPKCIKCLGEHKTADCKNELINHSVCAYCHEQHEAKQQACPFFRKVNRDFFNMQREQLHQKNKVKMSTATSKIDPDSFPALTSQSPKASSATSASINPTPGTSSSNNETSQQVSQNRFSILSDDEDEEEVIEKSVLSPPLSTINNPWAKNSKLLFKSPPAKRKATTYSQVVKAPATNKATMPTHIRAGANYQQSSTMSIPPGFQRASNNSSPISDIIISICSALGLTDEWLAIIKSLAPIIASLIESKLSKTTEATFVPTHMS